MTYAMLQVDDTRNYTSICTLLFLSIKFLQANQKLNNKGEVAHSKSNFYEKVKSFGTAPFPKYI